MVKLLRFDPRHVSEVARLTHPPSLLGPAFSVSSDGRWILSVQRREGGDLMLVEDFR